MTPPGSELGEWKEPSVAAHICDERRRSQIWRPSVPYVCEAAYSQSEQSDQWRQTGPDACVHVCEATLAASRNNGAHRPYM